MMRSSEAREGLKVEMQVGVEEEGLHMSGIRRLELLFSSPRFKGGQLQYPHPHHCHQR
jgi:hypothetical protein